MPETIYASFADATLCEQAAGALLDYGVRKDDISLVSHDSYKPGASASSVVGAGGANASYAAASADLGGRSPGATMGTAALAGQNTLGNNVAFNENQMPPSQSDLVASGHAASNYSDAHAALSNVDYNREFREQRDAPLPDTTATNVGRFGETGAASADRSSSPASANAPDSPIMGYGATEVPGTGDHSTATDHDPIATVTHLSDTGTASAAAPTASASPAFRRQASVMDAGDDYATNDGTPDVEGSAKRGLSVTTAADAEAGAGKGAVWGAGVGVLAGIAALMVPGVGWVVGGGALATAIGGLIGSTVAGANRGRSHGIFKRSGRTPRSSRALRQRGAARGSDPGRKRAFRQRHARDYSADTAKIPGYRRLMPIELAKPTIANHNSHDVIPSWLLCLPSV